MGSWMNTTLLPGRVGERSLPPTSPRSSSVTTRFRRARPSAGRCCAGKGLYSSHLAEWRKQRDTGVAAGLAPRSSAGKRAKTPEQKELDTLRRRNAALESELAKTRLALEITGKAHALLELLSESADTDPRSTK